MLPASKKPLRWLIISLAVCVSLLGGLWLTPIVLVHAMQSRCSSVIHHPEQGLSDLPKTDVSFWLANHNDPLPPSDYLVGDPDRISKWYWRNPLHNFTFFVIGVTDKEFERVGLYPSTNFSPTGGWNWCVIKINGLELPFISYESGKLQTYFGWREQGAFGVKLNL